MLKRPAHRFHPPTTPNVSRPTSGVLANIIQGFKTEPTRPQKQEKFAIQASNVYARLLEKNYAYYGVPFKSPDIIELQPPKKRDIQDEPELDFVDKVYLKLVILKSGKVRVKLIPHFLELWNNYYSKGKKPPIKLVIAAYKAIGFSDVFLQKINTNQKKRIEFAKKIEKIIEKIFDKTTTTKRKPATVAQSAKPADTKPSARKSRAVSTRKRAVIVSAESAKTDVIESTPEPADGRGIFDPVPEPAIA